MTVIRPQAWAIKPPLGVQINWGHPLAAQLLAVYPFSTYGGMTHIPELVAGRNLSFTGSSGLWNQRAGKRWVHGFDVGPTANEFLSGNDDYRLSITSRMTAWIAGWYQFNDGGTGSSEGLFLNGQSGSEGYNWLVSQNDSIASFQVFVKTAGAGSSASIAHGIAAGSGEYVQVALIYDGVNVAAVLNGISGTPTAKTGNVDTTDFSIVIGQWGTTGINNKTPNFVVDIAAVWNRALSVGELLTLYADPYAFLQPPAPQRRYFLRGAAAGAPPVFATRKLLIGVGR